MVNQTAASVGDLSCKAENDLSAKQNYIVELSGADLQVDVCDNAGDIPLGVLLNKPKAGEAADVRTTGIAPVISDGTTPIAVNDRLKTDGNGKAIKSTTNGDKLLGIALAASAADGTVIPVFLTIGAMNTVPA
jgi:predicted RecA/RadA family phage recombinase